jgi:hypothetical protein
LPEELLAVQQEAEATLAAAAWMLYLATEAEWWSCSDVVLPAPSTTNDEGNVIRWFENWAQQA